MLNRNEEKENPCPVLYLREKAFTCTMDYYVSLWACPILSLLCWGTFFLHTICWEFLSSKYAEFGQMHSLQLLKLSDHMIFICHSFTVCIPVAVEPVLHSSDKYLLIMVQASFNVHLKLGLSVFCWGFYQGYLPIIFISCSVFNWLWSQGNAGFIKWIWACCLIFSFLEKLEKGWS